MPAPLLRLEGPSDAVSLAYRGPRLPPPSRGRVPPGPGRRLARGPLPPEGDAGGLSPSPAWPLPTPRAALRPLPSRVAAGGCRVGTVWAASARRGRRLPRVRAGGVSAGEKKADGFPTPPPRCVWGRLWSPAPWVGGPDLARSRVCVCWGAGWEGCACRKAGRRPRRRGAALCVCGGGIPVLFSWWPVRGLEALLRMSAPATTLRAVAPAPSPRGVARVCSPPPISAPRSPLASRRAGVAPRSPPAGSGGVPGREGALGRGVVSAESGGCPGRGGGVVGGGGPPPGPPLPARSWRRFRTGRPVGVTRCAVGPPPGSEASGGETPRVRPGGTRPTDESVALLPSFSPDPSPRLAGGGLARWGRPPAALALPPARRLVGLAAPWGAGWEVRLALLPSRPSAC